MRTTGSGGEGRARRHISLPLIAEEANYRIGSRIWTRQVGEALVPALYPPDDIRKIRADRGEAGSEPLQGAEDFVDPVRYRDGFRAELPARFAPLRLAASEILDTVADEDGIRGQGRHAEHAVRNP
jgi:hypothetical protein